MRCPVYPRPHRLCLGLELRVHVPSVGEWIPALSVGPCVQSSGQRITTEINMEGSHSCSLSMGRIMPEGFCFDYLTSIFSMRSAQNRKRLITLNGSVQGLTVLRGLLCEPTASTSPPASIPQSVMGTRTADCSSFYCVLAFSCYESNIHPLFKNQKIRTKEIN